MIGHKFHKYIGVISDIMSGLDLFRNVEITEIMSSSRSLPVFYGADFCRISAHDVTYYSRIREHRRFKSVYLDQFTFAIDGSGLQDAELDIVMECDYDFYFYGYENAEEDGICAWCVIDLAVFRRNCKEVVGRKSPNTNTGKRFVSYRFLDFPDGIVVASNGLYYAAGRSTGRTE